MRGNILMNYVALFAVPDNIMYVNMLRNVTFHLSTVPVLGVVYLIEGTVYKVAVKSYFFTLRQECSNSIKWKQWDNFPYLI